MKVLKKQSENLVFNAEIRYEMETDGEVTQEETDSVNKILNKIFIDKKF